MIAPVRARDEDFMAQALSEARRSLDLDEFPVGAVLVLHDEVVARALARCGATISA
jgi:tRNA(Arg) A34 adenosine deaminase TadA